MHEPACFMRKYGGFAEAGSCKCFLDIGLRYFGKSRNSRIVQTESMSFLVDSR